MLNLTTRYLMKIVKTLTGHDMKSFEKKWLYPFPYNTPEKSTTEHFPN